MGMTQAPLSVEDCAKGLLNVIDTAERKTHGWKLWQWDGEVLPW